MKKVLIGLIVIIGLVALGLSMSLNSIIESGVETVGSEVTGTAVQLDSSNVSVFSGSGSLKGLSVANPQGFSAPNAFTLGEISMTLDTATVLDDTVVIKSVRVVNPSVVYELAKKQTNLDALLANVQKNTGGSSGSSGDSSGGSQSEASAKKVIIDELLVTGGRVEVRMSSMQNAVATANLPDIRLTGLGRDKGGVDPKEVMGLLFAEFKKATVEAVPNPARLLKNALEDSTEQVGDKLRSTGEAVEDKVKGLFKK